MLSLYWIADKTDISVGTMNNNQHSFSYQMSNFCIGQFVWSYEIEEMNRNEKDKERLGNREEKRRWEERMKRLRDEKEMKGKEVMKNRLKD